MKQKLFKNTLFWLVVGLAVGIILGSFIGEHTMEAVLVIRQICGQIVFFIVPLIIIGFIAPSISSLKDNATKVLLLAFGVAYLSTIGASIFAMGASYSILPRLSIGQATASRELPTLLFNLQIPPIMSVMSALVLAIFLGLGALWTHSQVWHNLLVDFREIVLLLVKKILIPILPFYIASNFCALTYQGMLPQMKVFLLIILIAIGCHFIWLFILYLIASLYTGKNGWKVVKHYGPAYLTALGTMSSAATLGVALRSAHRSGELDDEAVAFCIPLFNNIHLCGSALTEVFFVCAVSQVLYGALPTTGSLLLFIVLLGIFALGAPGVPGGTVMASLGLVLAILQVPTAGGGLMNFTDAGTSLLITIFALQDSFGTACNITGDGALTMIVNKSIKKNA